MDVLCADKTGTLTRNELTVTDVRAMAGFDRAHVLALAALASSEGGQDPVDAAIRAAASRQERVRRSRSWSTLPPSIRRRKGPRRRPPTPRRHAPYRQGRLREREHAGAAFRDRDGGGEGAGGQGLQRAGGRVRTGECLTPRGTDRAQRSAARGFSLADRRPEGFGRANDHGDGRRPRDRGDCRARGWPRRPTCPPGAIPDRVAPEQFAVFAGVLPEDKYKLVKALEDGGHIVGMCGDGANDAPALRQAQIGIAVSTATDVAKSAAGMVLTAGRASAESSRRSRKGA